MILINKNKNEHEQVSSSRLMWKLSAQVAGRSGTWHALTNFSQGENQQTVFELSCSAEFVRSLDGEFIFLSAVNIFLSVTAFLGNTLILVALHKETSLNPPSKLLYRNLAITDLCVGIISEPVAVTYWISVVNERWDICYYAYWANKGHFMMCKWRIENLVLVVALVLIEPKGLYFLHFFIVPFLFLIRLRTSWNGGPKRNDGHICERLKDD